LGLGYKGTDMVYYCKIIDDDKSYTIHGPYTLEEMKYAISLKNISVNDWFAKLNEADSAKKPLKINTWLPANSFDEFHISFCIYIVVLNYCHMRGSDSANIELKKCDFSTQFDFLVIKN
jgi:hypothetical protein